MSKASDLARLVTSGATAIHGEAGVTSSGSTGATTNLQQGLCKQWMAYDHDGESTYADVSGTTLRDSFNTSSVTDTATGVGTPSFTNNMSNTKFSATTTSHWKGHTTSSELYLSRFAGACNFSTSAYSFGSQYSNGNAQDNYICTNVSGDLA